MSVFVVILLILLLVLLAVLLVVVRSSSARAAARSRASAPPVVLGGACGGAPGHAHTHSHPLGDALHAYTREQLRAGPVARLGGAAGPKRNDAPKPKKPWTEYASWAALREDPGAESAYIDQRADVLNAPDLDWSGVLAEMGPKLHDNYEHIGIINVGADGRTLKVVASEASPIENGKMGALSETAFAGVPSELVAKYAERPGMFIFHTHPADLRASPLPSSPDISTAIWFGAMGRFAANVIISRYGVLAYTVDAPTFKYLNESGVDWKLGTLNLSHDAVAAHEAVRSWSSFSIPEYLRFFPRHRLIMLSYPSSAMVSDAHRYHYLTSLETPIDHAIIESHRDDIAAHLRTRKKSPAGKGAPGLATEPGLATKPTVGLAAGLGPGLGPGLSTSSDASEPNLFDHATTHRTSHLAAPLTGIPLEFD